MLERYKELVKSLGYSGREMSEKLRMTYLSYRSMVGGSRKTPNWVNAFLVGYDMGVNGGKKEEVKDAPKEEIEKKMTWRERLELQRRTSGGSL